MVSKRDKVIKGLENCLHYKGHCFDCPYNSPNCQNDVLNDAIALLKEQNNNKVVDRTRADGLKDKIEIKKFR